MRRPNNPHLNTCHACPQTAAFQWQRRGTDEEHTAHWDALEAHIRTANSGRADVDYVQDRTDTIAVSVFGCPDHNLRPAPADDTPEAHDASHAAGIAVRALLHDSTCAGHDACKCAGQPR
jgi:hypothetical protein